MLLRQRLYALGNLQIVNLGQWHAHILDQLDREIAASADAGLIALREEIADYPHGPDDETHSADPEQIWVPLVLDTVVGRLSFISTITVFGTAHDITLYELALEAFYPADRETADILHNR